jgi:hypothetical protein
MSRFINYMAEIEKMDREEQLLIRSATPLVFRLFGQAERRPDQREVRVDDQA